MSTKYANDTRVVQVDAARYDLPSPEGWTVQYQPELRRWWAFAENEDYNNPPYHAADTADEAIALIIGEPR